MNVKRGRGSLRLIGSFSTTAVQLRLVTPSSAVRKTNSTVNTYFLQQNNSFKLFLIKYVVGNNFLIVLVARTVEHGGVRLTRLCR